MEEIFDNYTDVIIEIFDNLTIDTASSTKD